MLGHSLTQALRLQCRAGASRTLATAVSPSATPIAQPVLLELTQPLKTFKTEPRASEHVVALDPSVFNHPIRRDILHLCAVHHLDGLRQGTASTKTRGEVRGSGAKIRPQKGSGRARLGDGQSPMLYGGGVAFGPKPRDFSTKLPRKVIQMGMRVALSAKVKERKLGVMSRLDWPNAKTKYLKAKLEELGLRKTLFVTGEDNVPLGLSRAINMLKLADATTVDKVNVYELMQWDRIILDIKAVEYLERTLGKNVPIAPLPLVTEVAESTLVAHSAL
ncbi:50S ribosomal protein L4 [Coprinellus micaceus]|uniref:Large ribosomal subunit protein uL4m n=1 Tax=Coprinellus micaceus TaxID=71717 RepID=A0A4Y7TLY6_COPMI|nr:50S ribosomal protein L4 [Coprinellus micaceus]